MKADSEKKWMSLGANLGVVIELFLLILELNQNSDLARAQIHQARSDAQVSRLEDRADTKYLAPLLDKIQLFGGFANLSSTDEFTPDELIRFRVFLQARHQDYDNLFYQYQQGYLDEEYYQFTLSNAIRLFSPWWDKLGIFEDVRRPSFDAEI